jgi:hypothetical protein
VLFDAPVRDREVLARDLEMHLRRPPPGVASPKDGLEVIAR